MRSSAYGRFPAVWAECHKRCEEIVSLCRTLACEAPFGKLCEWVHAPPGASLKAFLLSLDLLGHAIQVYICAGSPRSRAESLVVRLFIVMLDKYNKLTDLVSFALFLGKVSSAQ